MHSNTFATRFADGTLLSVMIFFIIVFMYAVVRILAVYFGWSPGLSNYTVYYVYLLVSLIGIMVYAFSFKLSSNSRINFALMTISVFFSIYVVEIFLLVTSIATERSKGGRYQRAKIVRAAGFSFDTRSPLEVYLDLKEDGVDVSPSIIPGYLLDSYGKKSGNPSILPLGGVSGKKTIFCNESGEYNFYESDEHGFNNPFGVFTYDEVNILLVGDSFTHGMCVKPGEDIGGQLRKTGKKVINLGMTGDGPLLELATLKEYGEPTRPEIVLWMYFEGNDLGDLAKEKKSSFLLRYYNEDFSQGLIEKQAEIDRILQRYITEQAREMKQQQQTRFYSLLVKAAKLWHLRTRFRFAPSISTLPLPSPSSPDQESSALPNFSLFQQLLKKANELTGSWGGRFYVVYLPDWKRYSNQGVDHDRFRQRDQILSSVQSQGIPVIDIHEIFVNHKDPLSLFPFRVDGHYTSEGYHLVAQKIMTSIFPE